MTSAKHPSARRVHLLAGLEGVAATLRHPLLDLGGSRRVAFSPTHLDAASRGFTVVANIVRDADPDVLADAHVLPFADATFETVLLAETLEHLRCPAQAVDEIHRVLRPGGRVIVTVPFAYRVHGDPFDYHRFTPEGLREMFWRFETIERLDAQGGPWSVIACVLRDVLYGAKPRWMPGALRGLFLRCLPWLARRDASAGVQRSDMLRGWTTGYLLIARRSADVTQGDDDETNVGDADA